MRYSLNAKREQASTEQHSIEDEHILSKPNTKELKTQLGHTQHLPFGEAAVNPGNSGGPVLNEAVREDGRCPSDF